MKLRKCNYEGNYTEINKIKINKQEENKKDIMHYSKTSEFKIMAVQYIYIF